MTTTPTCSRRRPRALAAIVIGALLATAFSATLGIGQGHAGELQAGAQAAPSAVKVQAVAKGSKYALLAKDNCLYPCNSKGKKLANAWDAYSTNEPYRVTKLFVAADAKKLPGKVAYREYYKYSKKTYRYSYYLASLSKVKNVTFLLKSGKNNCKSVAANAFSYHSGLKTLTNFGKTRVTSIGRSAFSHSALRKVALPATLKTLGSSAFYGCKSLTAVNGFDKTKVTSLSDYAFYGCSSLTAVSGFGKSKVASVGDYAFRQCALKAIALPATLKSIGSDAFYGCRSLTGITLPAATVDLGFGAFQGCAKLGSLTMNATTVVRRSDNASAAMDYVLKDTPIANASTAACIYVPKSLLATYQSTASTNPWRTYAAKFRAIA